MNQETKFGTEKISKLMLELSDISSDRNTDRQFCVQNKRVRMV